MAESTREQARQRRTEARERRRTPAAQPFDEVGEAADGSEPEGGGQDGGEQRSTQRPSDLGQAVKRTAATAAVAAAFGALAGAAKALIERRSDSVGDGEEGSGEPRAQDQADQSQEEPATEDVASVDEEAPAEEGTSTEDEAATEPDPQAREEADESEAVGREAASGERDDLTGEGGEAESDKAVPQDAPRPQGMAGSDAAEIVGQARRELERVLDQEAESVSSLERSNGHWAVTLEVVEVRRIPDSTDILSSYEVVLDDDRNVVRVTRTHRYRRSQVEEGR